MGNDTAHGGLGDDWVVGGKDNDALFGDDPRLVNSYAVVFPANNPAATWYVNGLPSMQLTVQC